jgi:hypothetical protein
VKTILVLILLLIASQTFANVGSPPDYPNEKAEMIFIGASVALSALNISGLTAHEPSYWLGGIGMGIGAVTLGLMTSENPRFEKGLFVTGTIAAATGLITVLQRRVLDSSKSARLEPSWSNGSTGLAFVVDF